LKQQHVGNEDARPTPTCTSICCGGIPAIAATNEECCAKPIEMLLAMRIVSTSIAAAYSMMNGKTNSNG
jgi:hypothetical protein